MNDADIKSPFPDLYKVNLSDTDIRASILRALYEAFFSNDTQINLEKLSSKALSDERAFQEVVGKLKTEGSIKLRTGGQHYRITASGILVTEEDGLVSEELVERNRRARIMLLDELVRVYDEKRWLSGSNVAILATNTNLDLYSVISNLRILSDFDYVKSTTAGSYAPTKFGIKVIKNWRQREERTKQ